jgi:hypothetical protein
MKVNNVQEQDSKEYPKQSEEAEVIDLSRIREQKKTERANRRANMERDKLRRRMAFAS